MGYPLPEILLVVLCGTMAGAENFVEIERWAKAQARLSAPPVGVPARLGSSPRTAIDGKTSRRAKARAGPHPLHLVSASATRQRLVLGQEAVATKGNEITTIPLLLARIEITGTLVTLDAMGCQREIAQAIRARRADYLLALQDNGPTFAEEVRLFFDTAPAPAFDTHVTIDSDHGRIEIRRHRVSCEIDCLATSRRFPGETRFPDLAAITLVEAEVERDGNTRQGRPHRPTKRRMGRLSLRRHHPISPLIPSSDPSGAEPIGLDRLDIVC